MVTAMYYFSVRWLLGRKLLHQRNQSFVLSGNKTWTLLSSVCPVRAVNTGGGGDREPGSIQVNYITKTGERIVVYGKENDNVMHLAQQNNIDIEGACEASLACCTCHVYVRPDYFAKLDPSTEEEEDLLDMAPFLKPNSRLSCQIILSKKLDGIEVTLPPATRNFYVDDHKPKHH